MVKCVGKDHLHQTAPDGKMEPAPGAFHAGCAKGADIGCEQSRVPDRLVGPLGARTRRGFVADDDPSGGGLGQMRNEAVFQMLRNGMILLGIGAVAAVIEVLRI